MKYDDTDLTSEQIETFVSPPPAPASLLTGLESRIGVYKQYLSAPLSQEQLRQALQHQHWEIRCAVLERLSAQHKSIPVELLKVALEDENPYVRAATLQLLKQQETTPPASFVDNNLHAREWMSLTEERNQTMSSLQRLPETRLDANPLNPNAGLPRKGLFQRMRLVSLIAALVIMLGALTAAGFGFGWWDPLFGSPGLYTPVNQQQTHQGVTVVITSVYADQERTIIAYDTFSKDSNKQYYLDDFNLTGSAPQKPEITLATYGEQGKHYYMIQPPFLVPANVNTLKLTLTIGKMLTVTPGQGQTSTITASWHFVFTVPFHHGNNAQIPLPIHGDSSK